MALATTTTPGNIVLAGDLRGNANAPELRITGVIPGVYANPNLIIDSKGRVIDVWVGAQPVVVDATSTTAGIIQLLGDLTGTAASPQLKTNGVTSGSYSWCNITVDAKGLITSISNGNLTLPSATSTVYGGINLAGDLTGTAAAPILINSGVTAGTYTWSNVVINSKGLITSISNATPPNATSTIFGITKLPSQLTLSGENPVLVDRGLSNINGLFSTITIDQYGLITSFIDDTNLYATSTTYGEIKLAGDLTGTATSPQLKTTGVTAGTYNIPNITVNSKGLITNIVDKSSMLIPATSTTKGTIKQTGDFEWIYGTGLLILKMSGVIPENDPYDKYSTLSNSTITINSKGFISNISLIDLPIASNTVLGYVKIDDTYLNIIPSNLGYVNGNLSIDIATNTTYGIARGNGSTFSSISGELTPINVVELNSENIFARTTYQQIITSVSTPDLNLSNIFQYGYNITPTLSINAPINGVDGQTYLINNASTIVIDSVPLTGSTVIVHATTISVEGGSGYTILYTPGDKTFYYTTNLITFGSVTINSLLHITKLIFDNSTNKYIAIMQGIDPIIGQTYEIYISSNLTTWYQQFYNQTHEFLDILPKLHGYFMAIGKYGYVVTSPDGLTWTPLNTGTANDLIRCEFASIINFIGWVITIQGTNKVLYITTSLSPTIYTIPSHVFMDISVDNLNNKFYGITVSANYTHIYESTNLTTWTLNKTLGADAAGNPIFTWAKPGKNQNGIIYEFSTGMAKYVKFENGSWNEYRFQDFYYSPCGGFNYSGTYPGWYQRFCPHDQNIRKISNITQTYYVEYTSYGPILEYISSSNNYIYKAPDNQLYFYILFGYNYYKQRNIKSATLTFDSSYKFSNSAPVSNTGYNLFCIFYNGNSYCTYN